MHQITSENLVDLRIGDVITNKKDNAKWVVIADPTQRGSIYDGEMIVDTKVYSQADSAKGWCGFTLGTNRSDLAEFFVLSQKDYPEYYL